MSATSTLSPTTQKVLKRKKSWGNGEIKRHIAFLTMMIPGLAFLLCFSYLPMPGILLAFKEYHLEKLPPDFFIKNRFIYSLFVANEWVGIENFKFIFLSRDIWVAVRNTVGYNLVFMVVGLFSAVGLALMINELAQPKMAKLYHTILFLPHFLSWVVVSYLVYGLVAERGIITQMVQAAGGEKIAFYMEPKYWPYIFLFFNIWKHTGNSSIIYLATLTGFDQELYEAAAIDGASKWKQVTKITIPQLIPIIVLLQILAIGRIFSDEFDMFYALPNGAGALRDVYYTVNVYVYQSMRSGMNISYPTAAGLMQSVVGLIMIVTTNLIVRQVAPEMSLF